MCKWEGDWEDSWVRHDEMGATEAMRTDMERARRLRRVAATFREWLEAEARRGERNAGLGTKKAEDALPRVTEPGKTNGR